MTGHETLRSIPNLLEPSRPKKSPSPRLTPRRSSAGRRSSEGRFSLGRMPMMGGGGDSSHGNENESENHHHHHHHLVNSVTKNDPSSPPNSNTTSSKPLISRIQVGNNNSSIVTSPLESSAKKKKRRQLLRQQQLEDAGPSSPTSPSPASFDLEGLDSVSPSAKSDGAAFAMEAAATDEDCAPLTPRNLVMEVVGAHCTLTPPVSALTPLIVSAKRAGSIGRSHCATKRRRPLHADNDESSSSSDEDDTMKLPEGLSPTQRAQEYWKRCYGDLETQQHKQVLARHESWSATRAAPTKSW